MGRSASPVVQGPTRSATRVTATNPDKERDVSVSAAASVTPTEISPETTATDLLAKYVAAHGGKRVIRKVLIANNGMAATKSIISMRRWAYCELGDENAIEFLAMATPEDLKANAEFIRFADDFVEVPGGKNSNNYANVNLIVDIAEREGVDAVWPGWGHASENPKLPTMLKAKGITFIGPTAPVMSVLGGTCLAFPQIPPPCLPVVQNKYSRNTARNTDTFFYARRQNCGEHLSANREGAVHSVVRNGFGSRAQRGRHD